MVKHIVLFELTSNIEKHEKEAVMKAFKSGIEALPEVIPFIRKIEVGFNTNPEESFDIALYSEFDSLDDVKAYASHPEHVKVASLLKDYKKSRSCVDYEF